MYEMAIIGEIDSILPFRALGLEVYEAESSNEVIKIIKQLFRQKTYKVLIVTETYFEEVYPVSSELEKKSFYPSVIFIPSNQGSKQLGLQKIRKIIERAVGVDLLFKE
ncbi:MAG: V-type ATP synthase subunit F [Candidatus Coatesbacteria bacterium]|nr:V-type ATP synthase subunit F [Candidatus Coatesbacteria bacterium]